MRRTPSTTLLTLPSELIEAILICSCSPRTVASIAQTCQTLHTLVYASPDSHLWRELFLTTWDDPRPALEHRALVDPRVNPTAWDWGTEYRRRVHADKWLKAWRRDILHADVDPHDDPAWYAASMSTLVAVLDTLMTLRPFPASPPIALTVLTPPPVSHAGPGAGEGRERMTSAPPLPPLLIVLASGFLGVAPSQSGIRLGRMVYGPYTSRAMQETTSQTRTPTSIPTPSLPPHLVRALLASHTVGVRGVPPYAPHLWDVEFWGRDPLGDVFHRIICITGFVPIPRPVSTPKFTFTPGSVAQRTLSTLLDAKRNSELNGPVSQGDGEESLEKSLPDGYRMGSIPKPFLSPSEQHADARILARRRVYDMRYLRGDRLWGPFHPVSRESLDPHSRGSSGEPRLQKDGTGPAARGWQRLNTLAWAMGMDVELDDLDSTSDDDSDDEDWRDPAETDQEVSSSSRSRNPEPGPVATGQDSGTRGGASSSEETGHEPSILSSVLVPSVADDPELTTNSNASRRRTRRSNARPSNAVSPSDIKPEHLKPDYTYLASARIAVEANLKELFGSETSDDVELASSEMRAGGVGMFWEDEDENIQTNPEIIAPTSHVSSSTATTPGRDTTGNTTHTFDIAEILSRFQNLEVARLGSACGYWSAWIPRWRSEKTGDDGSAFTTPSLKVDTSLKRPRIVTQRAELEKPTEDTSTTRDKGKGKEKYIDSALDSDAGVELGDWEAGPEGEACEGWDWAGVAGIWRRCVCWMDYRELLFFNLDPSKFTSLSTQEACRIIPMELRITGYTRARLMPVYESERAGHGFLSTCADLGHWTGVRYFRPLPVIHFSGLSVGSDRDWDDARPISGSVQLIGGGEVWWQLDTFAQESTLPGSSAPEWSSEGVQVGGIGSAVGILGMWTGAGHERADPLGPFWMWKVA